MQRLSHIDRGIFAAGRYPEQRLEFVLSCVISRRAFDHDFDRRDRTSFVIADLGLDRRKEQQAPGSRQQAEKQKASSAFVLATPSLCFLPSAFCLLLHFKISSGT